MIAYLKGKILNKEQTYIILLVNDIGYKIFADEGLLSGWKEGGTVSLYIYNYVREDTLALYGFDTLSDLKMFELLLGVSGIGPKSALAVFSVASATDIATAIVNGDPSLLMRVSGIGKKTAERVVLELRNRISKTSIKGEQSGQPQSAGADEIDALMSLGYSLSQAREALRQVDSNIKDSSKRIKAALRFLG